MYRYGMKHQFCHVVIHKYRITIQTFLIRVIAIYIYRQKLPMGIFLTGAYFLPWSLFK